MKFKETKVNQCTLKLNIDVDGNEIKAGYDRYYNGISKTAQIPGFRKGKVPRALLETHYQAEAKDQVLKDLVFRFYAEVLKEKKVDPFGQPEFSNIAFDDEKLSFEVQVEMRPEFEIKTYKNLKVKGQKVEVKDEEIDQQIDQIRKQMATQAVVENRPIQEGDFVVAETSCEMDGKVVIDKQEEAFEMQQSSLLADYYKNVKGMKLDEEKKFKVKFPKTYQRDEWQGKTGNFTIKIKEIKENILPEINEEFLKQVGDFSKLEDLKDAIKKDILAQKEDVEKNRVERELLEQISKATKFDLPNSLVEKRKEDLRNDQKQQLMYRGLSQEQCEKEVEKISKEIDQEAERQVKVAFILDKIGQMEKVEVEDMDLSEKFYELSRKYRRPVEEIREHYEKNDLLPSLRAELRNDKVIALIRENAAIS